MAELTGGQALVQSLKRHGVDTMFVLPGVQLDNTFDALYDEKDAIRVFHTRHEQATSYMADGYARTTGKPGVCLVVPGPGLLNAMAGLSTAYACNSPVLCISGQIQSNLIGLGRGMLHEIPHQLEMMKSVTKWAARIDRPEDAPSLVQEAFLQMLSGRQRPVELEMAPDVMGARADVSLIVPVATDVPEGDPDKLEAAARALAKAKKPVIFVGGGVFGATEELLNLAEMLQAPVVMSGNGKGAISSRNYLAQNMLGGRELWKDADVVLAVGTRFVQPVTMWGLDDELTIIQMDVDEDEVGRNHTPNIGIVSDAKKGLSELAARAARHNGVRASRKEELTALRRQVDDLLFEIQPQASYAEAIRAELPDDGIVVSESTQVAYWSTLGFPVYEPRTYLTSGYQGTLGYGFATALGAQAGNMDTRVVSVNGDGGFMYNVQELSTAVLHNIPLTTIVFNDNAFGNVKRIQQESYRGRTIASDLLNPDFVKLADSFGMLGIRANSPDELRGAIRQAFKHDGPSLIEAPVGPMPNPGRVTGWGAPPKKSRKD
ncbi:MAG TPA: thiamine pyrophosphate-dependent enzyme [Thermomicrobiales bacterium]|nr:thiamine pyrophosphate-dependent enzyme [Thermomicrobiales bacterium]